MTKPSRVIVVSFLALSIAVLAISSAGTASAATYSITKTKSGLVASDPLTGGDTSSWNFGGTASSHDYYEDSQGLHLGVKSPSSGDWTNYYAGASQSSAQLFHATETIPYNTVPDGVFNIGLYVEGSDYIPHVGCEAYADSTGYYWVVEQSSDAGQTYTNLYISQPDELPHTQDCTIITNGDNYLKVYIGGTMVYSSNSLSLGMSAPFNVFFQDDTSSSSMRYATYSDFYEASENVKVTNNPSNAATVQIADSSGNVLASSSVSGGTAALNVGKYDFPLAATINIYDSSNSLIASSSQSIYGGDTYSVTTSASAPQPPTSLTATATSSTQINLSWTAPSDNGGSAVTGYKIDRSTNSGSSWSTLVANTGSTSTVYSDTGLSPNTSYTYRVSAINSAGTSSPSNTASATTSSSMSHLIVNSQDSNGNPIPGFYTSLSQSGTQVDAGYTPYTFTLTDGQTYTVQIDTKYGSYAFSHWLDTGSTSYLRTISISSDQTIAAVYATIPQPPTNLEATAASSSQVNLSWTAPTNNGGSAVTGYQIDRSADGGTTWSTIVSNTASSTTTYSDIGLSTSTSYTYRVSAINIAGTSSPSNTASATTSSPITVPQPPTSLEATAISSSQINLVWVAPANNGGASVTGYKVERSTDSGTTWSMLVANTDSVSTAYSDTGLAASTSYTYRVSAINSAGTSSPSNTASATTSNVLHIIALSQSGLVASDSLTNETKTQQQLQANPGYWNYFGDAPAENATVVFFRDPQGLHMGVKAPVDGTYAGYYAESPNHSAHLWHAIISTPLNALPTTQNDYYENGLYVQTYNGSINYVSCFSDTSQWGTVWAVGFVTGNKTQATQFHLLWSDTSANQPLTRDCTLVTNGQNSLQAYIDGQMVYSNSTLNLQMPSPFNAYLEPQSSYKAQMLNGTFTDYYATTDATVTVNNAPVAATTAKLVDPSGNVLATVPVASRTAIFDIGSYAFPLSANIKMYDSNGNLVATTSNQVGIYGGDIYAAN